MGSKETPIQSAILAVLKPLFPPPDLQFCVSRENTAAGKMQRGKGPPRFMRFGTPGQPDITVFYRGIRCGIEVKAPGKKPSPEQRAYRDWLTAQGGHYVVAHSVDEALGGLIAAGILKRDASGAISRT